MSDALPASQTPSAAADLRRYWQYFCDCDPFPGSDDFQDRMEEAGFIETVPVEDADLERPFAAELGLEPGGLKWVLTSAGRKTLANDDAEVEPTEALRRAFNRYEAKIRSGELSSDAGSPSVDGIESAISLEEALELLDLARSAIAPFSEASADTQSSDAAENEKVRIAALDRKRAKEISRMIEAALDRGRPIPEEIEYSSSYWRQEYKGMEQAFMSTKCEYAEIALSMGFEGDAWFGDPLAAHAEIVARAKALFSGQSAGWLYDNEDTGREFSENHPVESGEVPDATNVIAATAANLLEELKSVWTMLEEVRVDRDRLASRVYDLERGEDT